MTFEPTSHLLAFVLPMSFKTGVVIFRATMPEKDVQVPIKPSERPRQIISTAQLTKGVWRAILNWSDGNRQYQEEKEIFVV